MEKEFIKYEQALVLKELGFDEPCFGHFVKHYDEIKCILDSDDFDEWWTNNSDNLEVKAPLYQQAFRWFREKYNLFHNIWNYTHGEPTDLIPNGFTFSIDEDWVTIIGKKEDGYFEKYYNTYEEAELECLKKLIEIVKTK